MFRNGQSRVCDQRGDKGSATDGGGAAMIVPFLDLRQRDIHAEFTPAALWAPKCSRDVASGPY
jgi:hypothetical protein